METDSTNSSDLHGFHQFLGENLANGGQSSPEECLEFWRSMHPSPEELSESVAAVNRALEQAEQCQGIPLEEFDRHFRDKHGLT